MFIRAALYTAGYVALAALGCGCVSVQALSERTKKHGLGKWLFLCVIGISTAAVFGGAAEVSGRGAGLGDIGISLAIMVLPLKRLAIFDIIIPVTVFLAARGYGIIPASLMGGILGLSIAAVSELILNPSDENENRKKLKVLAAVSYAIIGITELCTL